MRGSLWRVIALAVVFAICVVIYLHVANGSFSVCAVGAFTDEQKHTITSLDSIVDLSLKLSTTLVGFGAAALIGLKSGIRLSPLMRLSVVIATILFAQSALYAIWWRVGVADVYFNKCFTIIAAPRLQLRFEWHIYFFMLGLAAIAILVVEALFRKPQQEPDT